MANVKTWTPNETQKEFMEILKKYPDGATLKDIELDYGKKFATGSINTLLDTKNGNGKGYVDGSAKVEVEVAQVYRDVVIGKVKKVDTYKLTEKGLNA